MEKSHLSFLDPTLSVDVLGFTLNRLSTPLGGHLAMVLLFGSVFLLLVVVGL
jgi:hypothetical protein